MRILRDALMDTIMMYDLDTDENLYILRVSQFDDIVTHLAKEIITRNRQS